MQARWAVALLLMTTVFAGCADAPETVDDVVETVDDTVRHASGLVPEVPDPEVFLGRVLNDHATGQVGHLGHQMHDLHADSENFELLDYNDMSKDLIGYGCGYIEVDVVGDLMLVSSISGSRGASLVDVSDPANMEVLSHIYNLDDNWDARISDDGKYLFLGCQGSSVAECTGLDMSGETPTTTGGGPCASIATCEGGIAIFDIQEPTNPSFIDYVPMGFTHNVFSFMKDEKYYFMNAGVTIAEWDPELGATQIASSEVQGVHDIAIQQHPLTGDYLLYTGSGQGMSIWNVTDPFAPKLIGNIEAGEGVPAMWHEQTPMPCLIDGRHITIGAGESGGGAAQAVAVVDTTDPTAPVYLGKWQLPDHASITTQMMYRFSLHNIDGNCDGQVAVGHYHAGVWVFDISTPERMANPATLAFYMPHEKNISPGWSAINTGLLGAVITADVPNVWAAMWSDDGHTLFIPDMVTGVYALQPTWGYVNGEMAHDH